jgi:hypothetical protein
VRITRIRFSSQRFPAQLFISLFCACVASISAHEISLIEAGHAHACIVIGAKVTEVERFAAQELRHYVSEITREGDAAEGVQLVIVTDTTPHAEANCEILIGRPETHSTLAKLRT